MVEVELRAKATPATQKLIEKHAKKISAFTEEDVYFKCASDVERKLVIRIRKNPNGTFLTFKGASVVKDDIAWQEWETSAKDVDKLALLLLASGYVQVVRICKHRAKYRHQDIEVNFDIIDDLGTFVEAEVISDDVHAAQQKIKAFFSLIGISDENLVKKGYVKLMLKE